MIAGLLSGSNCRAQTEENFDLKPSRYFNDYVGRISPEAARRLETRLTQFERDTLNQVVVVVFPEMETGSALNDYTFELSQSWSFGQPGVNNGVVLFAFINSRRVFIQVGYGLKALLPEVRCRQIIEHSIKPAFRADKYEQGLSAGVEAIIRALTAQPAAAATPPPNPRKYSVGHLGFLAVPVVILFIYGFMKLSSNRRGNLGSKKRRPSRRSLEKASRDNFTGGGAGGQW